MDREGFIAAAQVVGYIFMAIGAFVVGGLRGWRGKQDALTIYLQKRVDLLERDLKEMHKIVAAQGARIASLEAINQQYRTENEQLRMMIRERVNDGSTTS